VLVETYAETGLWGESLKNADCERILQFDLSTVVRTLAGPSNPHRRLPVYELAARGISGKVASEPGLIPDGAVIINATAESALAGFSAKLNSIPEHLRHSFTYDQGREVSRHQELAAANGVHVSRTLFFDEARHLIGDLVRSVRAALDRQLLRSA
jgi:hypothetical protein